MLKYYGKSKYIHLPSSKEWYDNALSEDKKKKKKKNRFLATIQ